MNKCDNCEEEVLGCDECGYDFKKKDKIFCGRLGTHICRDCVPVGGNVK